MKLYELTTTAIGESYVRCYCWAESEAAAREMFSASHLAAEIHPGGVRELLSGGDAAFITMLSDSGFGERVVQ